MHMHISSIPDNVTVSHAGLFRLSFTDNSIVGNVCDERGRIVQTFRNQPALLSVAVHTNQAAALALEILRNLPAHEQHRVTRALGL